ncbi:MAG: hypothetical protein PSV16_05015 [Flavobacterium sp.]|nr:hypothetical protein [Flavobacterium sp.]
MEPSWTDIGSAVGQLASAFISLVGFYFVWTQIKQTNKNLRQSNHTAIYSINTEIYKFFAEHSELRPYFHEEKPLTKDDENRNKVFSLSELLADFFEYILVEKDSLAPEIKEPWRNYIKKIYVKSSAFREFIHTSKDQYSNELLSVFAETNFSHTDLIYSVRHLQNEKEFNMLDSIYQSCFGEHSVPTQRQKEWWTKSNSNILGLFSDKKIVGGVSFWNINFKTFEKLKTGQLKERDITIDDFDKSLKNLYYLSDLAIIEDCRQKLYSNLLLRNLVEQIENNADKNLGIKVLAFAFSESGNRILIRLGFEKIKDASETLDNQDLFLLNLKNHKDIKKIKKCLL